MGSVKRTVRLNFKEKTILFILFNLYHVYMVTRSDFNKYILPVYNPAKFIPKKAKGSYVWDQNNNKYLDFASGIAVSNLGHCHPTLVKTLNT